MLQWRPGSKNEIMWNDRQGGRFVSNILDPLKVHTGKKRTLPHPFYTVSPDGRSVVIDSPHGGSGRKMNLIDISKIVG